MDLGGVWIPLITPFHDGHVDLASLERLVERLVPTGISGLVAGATTGESLALSEQELVQVVQTVKATARGRVPLLAGAGGPDTRRIADTIRRVAAAGADGVLSICPYYVRPDQRGILAHFEALASSTQLPLVLYDNPSRTGVRMDAGTVRRLAELENVIGLKDCSGDLIHSMELLLDPPPRFAILCGDDAAFLPMLALGAAGGILASAHWSTASFVEVAEAVRLGDLPRARGCWARLLPVVRALFAEPSPAPVKHVLAQLGVITSSEVRLPLCAPSTALRRRLAVLCGLHGRS